MEELVAGLPLLNLRPLDAPLRPQAPEPDARRAALDQRMREAVQIVAQRPERARDRQLRRRRARRAESFGPDRIHLDECQDFRFAQFDRVRHHADRLLLGVAFAGIDHG